MVNKQVIGEERAGRTWGREETPVPGGPGVGRVLYRKEDEAVGGRCLRGLSGATLSTKNIYMHTQASRGHLGEARPSAPPMVTPGPS